MNSALGKIRDFLRSPASSLLVLLAIAGAYGIGYWRGNVAQAHVSTTAVTERTIAGTEEKQTQRGSVAHIYANEDVMETRLTMPPITLPDGSVRSQTRITRELAKEEKVSAVDTTKTEVKVVERIVEKRVPGANIVQAAAPPRFMIGPAVGRDFSADKYLFGGSAAVRLGPVWIRAAVDTRPAVIGSMEVPF